MTKSDVTRRKKNQKFYGGDFLQIHQRALTIVLNVSNRKSDNTFALNTFENKQLSFWAEKNFQVKINSSTDFVFFWLTDLPRY